MQIRTVVWLLVALALGACASRPLGGQSETAGVAATDRARMLAMIDANAAALDSILHEELTYIHSNGSVDSKTSLISNLVSGRVDYLSIEAPAAEARVRVHREAGIVTGSARFEIQAGQKRLEARLVYTAVYWLENGRWQLVAYHSSPVQ